MSTQKKKKRIIATNRRARHDYEVEEQYEAGLVLTGTEVKSLRQGHSTITEGYVVIKDGEAWIHQIFIAEYSHGNRENHETRRPRKLLLSLREIAKIQKKVDQKGFSSFAMELYFNGPWVKILLGVGRGKKSYDKRQAEKAKTARRELRKADW